MPGKVKVRVVAGRGLPVMDRGSDTTDAYVEVKLGDTTYKTEVFRKSLNPAWNSDWFRFELDDMELQDEPLQVRVMDYDTYSANDAIGKVYIDLNPLLLPGPCPRPAPGQPEASVTPAKGGAVLAGWLPVYDTLHGIRGEVSLVVKVELFSDLNRFRQSSCGVQFFCCPGVPEGFRAQSLPGFVEELVLSDDPEYKWIDKIRTPRASNEARQLLFARLSGEVRRRIGLKALELGGNAVTGYRQCFDLEGESGIVVRGIGTAVTLTRPGEGVGGEQRGSRENSAGKELPPEGLARAASRDGALPEPLDSSGTPPRGASVSASAGSSGSELPALARKLTRPGGGEGIPEFPFLTISRFPPGFLVHLGGMVSAKSVKLLEELDGEDSDAREAWWVEIRQEIRSHAKALGCNMVVGYQEKTVIYENVLILCSSGTAAVCNLAFMSEPEGGTAGLQRGATVEHGSDCTLCHIPYTEASVPFPVKLVRCGACGRGKVADLLITTVEPPPELEVAGQGGIIQARVLRPKRDLKGEQDAREVSDKLPFLEYEIHRQLVNKLKVKGMNAIFGLSVTISLADRLIVGLASGTAVYLPALPAPALPRVLDTLQGGREPGHSARLQDRLREKVEANREHFGLPRREQQQELVAREEAEVEEGPGELDLMVGNKDTCVLEVDDIEDADIVESLMDAQPPAGFEAVTVHCPVGTRDPGLAITRCQAFSQVWRGRLGAAAARDFTAASQHLLAAVCFKLRRLQPCLLSSLSWQVAVEDESEVQLTLSGVAVAFAESSDVSGGGKEPEGELVFRLEEEAGEGRALHRAASLPRPPPYFLCSPASPRIGVNLTPTPHVPGARIDRHLGTLNLFLIRETSGLREAGGLSSFVQRFLCEVLGVLRAQVSALGGNAVTSYSLDSCVLSHSPHKNQAQCLVNVGGDVVSATYVYR